MRAKVDAARAAIVALGVALRESGWGSGHLVLPRSDWPPGLGEAYDRYAREVAELVRALAREGGVDVDALSAQEQMAMAVRAVGVVARPAPE